MKENIQISAWSPTAFIDEYRLLAASLGDKSGLTLWDTTSPGNHQITRFEVYLGVDSSLFRNYGSNHEMPFREDPSRGIVALVTPHSGGQRMLVVPVRDLIALSRNPSVSLREHAAEIRPPKRSPFHVLHSRVMYWDKLLDLKTKTTTLVLTVHDFDETCRFKKEAGGDDGKNSLVPVKPLQRYHIEFKKNIDSNEYDLKSFLFTEDGIYVRVS